MQATTIAVSPRPLGICRPSFPNTAAMSALVYSSHPQHVNSSVFVIAKRKPNSKKG
jgi:hypothetical protein